MLFQWLHGLFWKLLDFVGMAKRLRPQDDEVEDTASIKKPKLVRNGLGSTLEVLQTTVATDGVTGSSPENCDSHSSVVDTTPGPTENGETTQMQPPTRVDLTSGVSCSLKVVTDTGDGDGVDDGCGEQAETPEAVGVIDNLNQFDSSRTTVSTTAVDDHPNIVSDTTCSDMEEALIPGASNGGHPQLLEVSVCASSAASVDMAEESGAYAADASSSSLNMSTSSVPGPSCLRSASSQKKKHRVRYSNVQVYYFPREQGFTTVPNTGATSLGMAYKHDQSEDLPLGTFRQLRSLMKHEKRDVKSNVGRPLKGRQKVVVDSIAWAPEDLVRLGKTLERKGGELEVDEPENGKERLMGEGAGMCSPEEECLGGKTLVGPGEDGKRPGTQLGKVGLEQEGRPISASTGSLSTDVRDDESGSTLSQSIGELCDWPDCSYEEENDVESDGLCTSPIPPKVRLEILRNGNGIHRKRDGSGLSREEEQDSVAVRQSREKTQYCRCIGGCLPDFCPCILNGVDCLGNYKQCECPPKQCGNPLGCKVTDFEGLQKAVQETIRRESETTDTIRRDSETNETISAIRIVSETTDDEAAAMAENSTMASDKDANQSEENNLSSNSINHSTDISCDPIDRVVSYPRRDDDKKTPGLDFEDVLAVSNETEDIGSERCTEATDSGVRKNVTVRVRRAKPWGHSRGAQKKECDSVEHVLVHDDSPFASASCSSSKGEGHSVKSITHRRKK